MSKKSPREYWLNYKYGITQKDYERILKQQGGVCAVCKRPPTKNLDIDHDHKTLEIFGLLCNFCNRQLIGRNRNWEHYEAAAKYLKSGLGIYVPVAKKRKRKSRKRKSRKG